MIGSTSGETVSLSIRSPSPSASGPIAISIGWPLISIPILIIVSEASYHAPYDHCTVKYLEQAGVRPTSIRLADRGVHGNSHVLMLEKNNKQIMHRMIAWLEGTVYRPK